jgi:hypothetical protein
MLGYCLKNRFHNLDGPTLSLAANGTTTAPSYSRAKPFLERATGDPDAV